MVKSFDQELGERLIRYAAIDSQSGEGSTSSPSSEIPLNILWLLGGVSLLKLELRTSN